MSIYTVHEVVNVKPPQWFIAVADDTSPGRPVPVGDIPVFTDLGLAEAAADRLNAKRP